MAAIEKNGKWYVKRRDGSIGKRGYKTKSNALKAQRVGRQNVTGKKPKKLRKLKTVKKSKNTGGKSMAKPWHIAPILGAAAVPVYIGLSVADGSIDWKQGLGTLCAAYTTYNPYTGNFDFAPAIANYGAVGCGTIMSWLAGKFGLNRKLPAGFNY